MVYVINQIHLYIVHIVDAGQKKSKDTLHSAYQ